MAFTKINAAGIGTTETVTVDGLTVINDGSFGGNLTVSGVLTYEDVTNVDSVGLITARNGIVVGSGITLSKDGDIFATGITTVSGNVKVGTGITLSPDGDGFYTGVVTATTFKGDGSQLTGVTSVGGATGVDFNDNVKVRFGTGNDTELYFDGTNMNIKATTNVQNVNIWTEGTSKYQFTDGSFRPLSDNSYDLGTSSLRWRDIYTGDLNLSNEGRTNDVDGTWGNYTIQEGESDLFLINNRTGKKYKFLLQEVE
jgi:hypothetical protein